MRRHLAPLLALLAATTLAPAAAAATGSGADALLGTWLTEPGDRGGRARVEISRVG
jgi:hypothetical protein